MAHAFLEFAERESEEDSIQLSFDRFFPHRFPGSSVLDFFSHQMREEFGAELSLSEITWDISRPAVNKVVENVMENLLRVYSEVIAQYDCDAIVLGGGNPHLCR